MSRLKSLSSNGLSLENVWAWARQLVIDIDKTVASVDAYSVPAGGRIIWHAAITAPTGWLLCNGATYNVSDYPALYAVIGTTYGGVAGVTFKVPSAIAGFTAIIKV